MLGDRILESRSCIAHAIPKSRILTVPFQSTIMLGGVTWRCHPRRLAIRPRERVRELEPATHLAGHLGAEQQWRPTAHGLGTVTAVGGNFVVTTNALLCENPVWALRDVIDAVTRVVGTSIAGNKDDCYRAV